jgi:hypothetical protein
LRKYCEGSWIWQRLTALSLSLALSLSRSLSFSLFLSRAGCRRVGATVPFPQGIRKESDLTAMAQRFLSVESLEWRGGVFPQKQRKKKRWGGGAFSVLKCHMVAIIFSEILFRQHQMPASG